MNLLLCGVRDVERSSSEAVSQIVAQIVLEAIPKIIGACGKTMNEDDGKEIAHAMSSAHMSGILQALDPFIVVIEQTPTLTGNLESLADNIVDGAKVLIGSSACKNMVSQLISSITDNIPFTTVKSNLR
jgi:hypothetical protein